MISPSIELLNAIEQTKSQVWLEQLRVLHGNQLTTFVGSWIAVVLLAYLYSEAIPRNYLVGWLVLASIVAVGRTTWWLAQKPSQFANDALAVRSYVRGSIWGSYFSGWVWASSVLAISLWPVSDLMRITLLFVLIGLGSSSIFSLASVWHVYMGFFVVAYVPVVAGFAWIAWQTSSNWYAVIAGLSLLYLIVNTRFAWKYHTTLLEALRLRFSNQALAIKVEQERDLAHSAKIAQENFIVAVTHDLRQPLQALSVFSNMLKSEAAQETRNKASKISLQELSELIHQSTYVLSEQVEYLLDIHRAEQDRQPKLETLCLRLLLERISREMRFIAELRRLSFKLKIQSADQQRWLIHTDPLLFERVIRNLLDNAFKYTSEGGVLLCLRRRAGQICVEVIDTGRGMDSQMAEQAHVHPDGFGFGLNIVRRLCQRLNHQIVVASRIGRGTRCTVRIQAQDQQCLSASEELDDSRSSPDKFIVEGGPVCLWENLWVLDDDPLALRSLEILLNPYAKRLRSFQKRSEFKAAIGIVERPDCVVLDWQLGHEQPSDSGDNKNLVGQATSAELVSLLREDYNFDIPVCIVSANIFHAKKTLGSLAAIEYLKKPTSDLDLRRAFDHLQNLASKAFEMPITRS